MAALVMVVVGHGEHRAADCAKSAFAPGFFFDDLAKRETHLPQLFEDRGAIGISPGGFFNFPPLPRAVEKEDRRNNQRFDLLKERRRIKVLEVTGAEPAERKRT